MGMAKTPQRTSWVKITWQRKKKRKKKKNKVTISKDNKKKEILSLLKLKDNKFVFIGDLKHSNPLLNSKTKT